MKPRCQFSLHSWNQPAPKAAAGTKQSQNTGPSTLLLVLSLPAAPHTEKLEEHPMQRSWKKDVHDQEQKEAK